MSYFRGHGACLLGALTGFAVGTGFFILYFRLQRELDELRTQISQLKQELAELTSQGRLKTRRSKKNYSGYFSVTASSGDDDDDFQDALAGGDTDVELYVRRENSAEGKFVQFATPVASEVALEEIDENFFTDVDKLLSGSKADIERAYEALQQHERKLSLRAEFQWRHCKAMYNVANQEGERGNAEEKKEMMYRAKDAAQAALKLDPSCAEAHKWFAITLGSVGDYEATSEKIKNAVVIKDHIQMAIKLNPSDPTPHHMLGRWCFSVYMLTWLERKAASAFFGTPPTSTVEEALEHFVQAENLNPGKWKENMLYVAKCLIEKRQYDEAAEWLRKASADLNDASVDDAVKTEIKSLLARYG